MSATTDYVSCLQGTCCPIWHHTCVRGLTHQWNTQWPCGLVRDTLLLSAVWCPSSGFWKNVSGPGFFAFLASFSFGMYGDSLRCSKKVVKNLKLLLSMRLLLLLLSLLWCMCLSINVIMMTMKFTFCFSLLTVLQAFPKKGSLHGKAAVWELGVKQYNCVVQSLIFDRWVITIIFVYWLNLKIDLGEEKTWVQRKKTLNCKLKKMPLIAVWNF